MKSLKARIREDNVRAESVMTGPPDWAAGDGWQANWYDVTLRRKRRQLTIKFGMGLGLSGEPPAGDVLSSLLMDASGYDNARSFEEWAGEYGYDTDSRKAERIYRQVEAQTAKLRKFLGDDYDAYLWETENDV